MSARGRGPMEWFSMAEILKSSVLVFVGEMGDKTQLLTLVLMARYKRLGPILWGVLLATLANHALVAFLGSWISKKFDPLLVHYFLAATFFAFALWMLKPDEEGEVIEETKGHGLFFITFISFFIAEMGDKTQLATMALAAESNKVLSVTIGSTVGMMGSNILAAVLGPKLLKRIPMQWVRRFASLLFVLFGLIILYKSGVFK